jgi:hypothetical protein
MMAQRYPTQYDGILATAPAINWDKFIPSEYWPQFMMLVNGKKSSFSWVLSAQNEANHIT